MRKLKKIFHHIIWLLTDGRYVMKTQFNCGCCGAPYEENILWPIYDLEQYIIWGLCPECEALGNDFEKVTEIGIPPRKRR